MSRLTPVSRVVLIRKLKMFGFSGLQQEGKHPYMIKGDISLTIPNPHENMISVDLLVRILRQAGITRDEWIKRK